MSQNVEDIKKEIIKKIKPLSPNMIIPFGAYANGTPSKDILQNAIK